MFSFGFPSTRKPLEYWSNSSEGCYKRSMCTYGVLHLVSVCGATGILNILFAKYTSCTLTHRVDDLDLLQNLCSSACILQIKIIQI